MGIFPKKSIENVGPRNLSPSPQTRRQVSAYGLKTIVAIST